MEEEEEEGQIYDAGSSREGTYNPAYEWPGDGDADNHQDPPFGPSLKPGHPVFRLVALRSSILHPKQKIAVLDAYPEIQIGRDKQLDGSPTPRVRLKEMAVSKLHATLYWDGARREWNIVDMGSMHGTFVCSGPVVDDGGTRLSQPRVASMPRRLYHADRLGIGGTTFEVHIHPDQRPCSGCVVTGKAEISLFPASSKAAEKRTSADAGLAGIPTSSSSPAVNELRDPRKALNMLKRNLLTRHDSAPSVISATKSEYVDRSARRRLLHPTRDMPPGVPSPSASGTALAQPETTPTVSWEPPPKFTVSEPPTPLPASNIGHKLLLQQGWTPGNALGDVPSDSDSASNRVGLVAPLEVKHQQGRAGLGMKQTPASELDLASDMPTSWKEREKMKRFQREFHK